MSNNNEWLDDVLETLSAEAFIFGNFALGKGVGRLPDNNHELPPVEKAKSAILSKLESIEQEAYKKGYVDGGIEILNASCEVCHAYPMTAGCNNANCHAIER